MRIEISKRVLEKLRDKHGVSEKEVEQCFLNHPGVFLRDTREAHASVPPTHWFIGYTNKRRELKIAFILDEGAFRIRSAFPPDDVEREIWKRKGGPLLSTGDEHEREDD